MHQAVGILRQAEEICLLLGVLHLTPAVGTFAVDELRLGPKRLAGGAVLALVGAFVDLALVIERLKNLLDALNVVVVGRADKPVVGDIHELPKLLDAGNDLIDIFLRRHPRGGGLLLDLQAVLVGAGQEHDVKSTHSLIAGHHIGRHGAIAVADVQLVRRVVDRRCNIECFFLHSRFLRKLWI